MNRLLLGCLALALIAIPARADEADARKAVEAGIKAAGASSKKNPVVTWKGKGKFYGMGSAIDYMGTWTEQLPDKKRMEIENAFTLVVNGDKGWFNDQEMSKEQLEEQKEDMYADWVMRLTPLTNKDFTLSSLGESKVGDKPVVGVKVSHKGHRDVNLYFDKNSHLLAKMEHTLKQMGNDAKFEAIITDWATINGVKVPSKMTIKRNGDVYVEGEMSDYKILDKAPDKAFEKP
jgi:outer membrane lipoprotein-sorting protein